MQSELAKASKIERTLASTEGVIEAYRELVKCFEERVALAEKLDALNNEIIENLKTQIKLLTALID